jgi:hypothetical protein
VSRSRRRKEPAAIPPHVWAMEPGRYRDVAARYLDEHPGDAFWAAMAVWQAYLDERRAWLRAHGIRRYVDGCDTLKTPTPPVVWVQETFGTPPARWPS